MSCDGCSIKKDASISEGYSQIIGRACDIIESLLTDEADLVTVQVASIQ